MKVVLEVENEAYQREDEEHVERNREEDEQRHSSIHTGLGILAPRSATGHLPAGGGAYVIAVGGLRSTSGVLPTRLLEFDLTLQRLRQVDNKQLAQRHAQRNSCYRVKISLRPATHNVNATIGPHLFTRL